MARYIDADKVTELIKNYGKGAISDGIKMLDPVDDIVNIAKGVELIPTAYVMEVKHGYWKEHYAFDCWHYDCPFCDDGYVTKGKDKTPPNYCQNCGAKMDGKRRQQEATV